MRDVTLCTCRRASVSAAKRGDPTRGKPVVLHLAPVDSSRLASEQASQQLMKTPCVRNDSASGVVFRGSGTQSSRTALEGGLALARDLLPTGIESPLDEWLSEKCAQGPWNSLGCTGSIGGGRDLGHVVAAMRTVDVALGMADGRCRL